MRSNVLDDFERLAHETEFDAWAVSMVRGSRGAPARNARRLHHMYCTLADAVWDCPVPIARLRAA